MTAGSIETSLDRRQGRSPIYYHPRETVSQIVLDPKAIIKSAIVDQGPLLPLTPSVPRTVPTSNTIPGTADNVNKMVARPQKALPTHLMSRFVTLVHNSEQAQAVLSAAIYVDLAEHKISKATIGKTISEVATKIKGKWIVKPEVLVSLVFCFEMFLSSIHCLHCSNRLPIFPAR